MDKAKKTEVPKAAPAEPQKGKIDYAALIREHMERYPKIRAYLAKH